MQAPIYIYIFLNHLRRVVPIKPLYLIILHKNKNILMCVHNISFKFRTFIVDTVF